MVPWHTKLLMIAFPAVLAQQNAPANAISEGDTTYVIDPELCLECGACASVCPNDAIVEE